MAPDQGFNLTSLGLPSGLAILQCNCFFFPKKTLEKKKAAHIEDQVKISGREKWNEGGFQKVISVFEQDHAGLRILFFKA